MSRALILCHDPLLRRTLQRAIQSLDLEPVLWSEAGPPLSAMDKRCAFAVLDLGHPSFAEASAATLHRHPPLPRVFLCGEREPPPLHEDDVALSGSFSLQNFHTLVLPVLRRPPPAAPGVFDPARLIDCAQGDPAEMDAMVDLFFRSAEAQLDRLAAALLQGQREEAQQACHRLCGAAATAGAEELALLCREAMRELEAGDREPGADTFEAALQRFREAYRAWREGPSPTTPG
jgi:HPt (histidine-containing phosphotransfer) domain-containing protein